MTNPTLTHRKPMFTLALYASPLLLHHSFLPWKNVNKVKKDRSPLTNLKQFIYEKKWSSLSKSRKFKQGSSIRPYLEVHIFPTTKIKIHSRVKKGSCFSKKRRFNFLITEVHILEFKSFISKVHFFIIRRQVDLRINRKFTSVSWEVQKNSSPKQSSLVKKKKVYVRIARGSEKYDMVYREIQLQKRKYTYVILGSYQLYD